MKKKIIALLGVSLLFTGMVAFSSTKSIIVAKAEDEEIVEVIEETNDDPSVIQEVKNYFETVILPAVIASASTLIITAAGLIIKTIMTKAKDKHITEQVDRSAEQIIDIKNKYVDMSLELTNKVKDIYQVAQNIVEENKLIKDFFELHKDEISKIPNLESEVNKLIALEIKLASIDKDIVASGVAEELNKLIQK